MKGTDKVGAPAVIICSLGQAVTMLNAARGHVDGLLLLSAPGAAASTGAALFKAMTDQAKNACPDVSFTAVLDCGSDAGHALAAIREGVKAVILSENCPARGKVTDVARQNDVQVLSPAVYQDQGYGEPLDLTQQADPAMACRVFLSADDPSHAPRPHTPGSHATGMLS